MIIAIIGPDGSGKSTTAQTLAEAINNAGKPKGDRHKIKDQAHVIHFRPNLIPNIRELITGEKFKVPEDGIIPPHTHPPSGIFGSIFRFLYYFFDYTVGHLIKVTPLLKRGKVVIFERHYYDFVVDPLRSRIRLPQWLLKFSLRFIPKTDFTFLLLASPEVMRKRKPELTLDELEEQIRDYRALLPSIKNAHEISSEVSIDEVLDQILKISNI